MFSSPSFNTFFLPFLPNDQQYSLIYHYFNSLFFLNGHICSFKYYVPTLFSNILELQWSLMMGGVSTRNVECFKTSDTTFLHKTQAHTL
jgi:hypothetical protein